MGSLPQPLPTILGCIFDISYNTIEGQANSTRMLNTTGIPFDNRYVKPVATDPNYVSNPRLLQGIIISKSIVPNSNPGLPEPSIQTFITSNGPSSVYSINYNIPSLTSTPNNNIITGYYKNYSALSIPRTIDFGEFTAGSPPSTNANYSFTYSKTTTSITLDINAPDKTNTDLDGNVTLSFYSCNYTTPGSTNRYNLPNTVTQTGSIPNIPFTSNPQSREFTDLFPDCIYTFPEIISINSLGLRSTSVPTNQIFNTDILSPSINGTSRNIITDVIYDFLPSSFVSSAFKVSDGSEVLNLFNNVSTNITLTCSTAKPLSIQYNNTVRGSIPSTNNIMSLSAEFNSNSVTKSFQGFPLETVATSVTNTITLTCGTTVDQFTTFDQNKGFYSKLSSFSVVIPNGALTASQYPNTINLTQTYTYFISGTLTTTTTQYTNTNNKFHYDNLTVSPSFSSVTFSPPLSSQFSKVSGINIIGVKPNFSVTSNITNLFKNFFKNNLLTYTLSNGLTGTQYETNLTNCTTTPIPIDGSLVTFTNPTVTGTSLSALFNKKVSLSVTATNFIGSVTSISQELLIIFDKLSYELIYNTTKTPTSIVGLNAYNTTYSGFRVWSAIGELPDSPALTTSQTYMPPRYGYNNTISYSKFKYSHNWNINSATSSENSITIGEQSYTIDARQELQVFNGYYQSISSNNSYINNGLNNGNVIGYADYGSYIENNGINYSGVSRSPSNVATSNYRFATFVWNYNSNLTTNTFIFTLKNFKYNGGKRSIISDTNNSFYVDGALNRFFLHYRAEQYDSNNTNYIVPASSNSSTVWVDGSSTMGTVGNVLSSNISVPLSISDGNYFNDADNTTIRASGSVSYEMVGDDLQASVSNILYGDTSKTRYIYCRIGLPMNANYAFEYITLTLKNIIS